MAAPGFKAAKDRITLLLGGNAEGEFKLKLLAVYHSENPRAFKALKEYCAKKNITHKALLILDNAPGHPAHLNELSEHVPVIFLPLNTMSMLQPMDQGVISSFKAYYLRRAMSQLIGETDDAGKPSIKEFWRGYHILKAVKNTGQSWKEVTDDNMNGVWRKLWLECVRTLKGIEETMPNIQRNIVELAKHMVGFEEVDEENVQELLNSHGEDLTNEELIHLEQEQHDRTTNTSTDIPTSSHKWM
ncbi:tigger transposable element-derived protein 1-like [Homarus americanus]|uniref:tigger transposable element-derived protein 1-like n=1 Tax=Homarus americanus TaxID=6706 RepID=UPI001C4398E3|nr:tigger transposable element-derived protein 1-like [Homarus americanus]